MKKLLFFFVIIIMTSCTISLEDSKIQNPEKSTTIEIQNNIIDSCAVLATDNNYIYILNKKTNLVEYKLSPLDADHEVISTPFLIFVIMLDIILLITVIRMVIDVIND